MGLHPALEVQSLTTYGVSCVGIFVKPGGTIQRGERLWWREELATSAHGSYTKRAILQHATHTEVAKQSRAFLMRYARMVDDDCYESHCCRVTPSSDGFGNDAVVLFNHGCGPNAAWDGSDTIVALRDVSSHEHVVYDYAFTETPDSFHYGLTCRCGSKTCRGTLDFVQYKDPMFIAQHYHHCTPLIQGKMRENGWHHDHVVRRHRLFGDQVGHGLFAMAPIPKGTIIILFAGKVVTGEYIESVPSRYQEMSLQIDDNFWQIPNVISHPASKGSHGSHENEIEIVCETGDYINHSCRPNCGMLDGIRVVTMRDVGTDEALTIDYAMVTTGVRHMDVETFQCDCDMERDGAASPADQTVTEFQCRGIVTALDYQTVGSRYYEFLSPFVRHAYDQYMNEHETSMCANPADTYH